MTKSNLRKQTMLLFKRMEANLPVINPSEQVWRDKMTEENKKLVTKYIA